MKKTLTALTLIVGFTAGAAMADVVGYGATGYGGNEESSSFSISNMEREYRSMEPTEHGAAPAADLPSPSVIEAWGTFESRGEL